MSHLAGAADGGRRIRALESPPANGYLGHMRKGIEHDKKRPGSESLAIVNDGGSSKVKFGQVVVTSPKPSRKVMAANIKRSSESLARVVEAVTEGGVTINRKKCVPRYFGEDSEQGVYRRRLDGKVERGRLVNGAFVVID